jgi:hypothetical protein
MKDMIQRMTDLESQAKQELKKSTITESCMGEGPMDMPMSNPGSPVSMNISLNASGKEHVADLINMMKNAGMAGAEPVTPAMMPMRTDMERLRGIVGEPEALPAPAEQEEEMEAMDGGFGDATTEPDEEYGDIEDVITSGNDLHKEKKSYKVVAGGDNPMEYEATVESIKDTLYAALSEKKGAKPDFLDMDGDGDKKEPMKKAIADKKAGPKKGVNPFVKKESVEEGWDDMMKAAKDREKEKGTGKFDSKKTSTGTVYTKKSSTYDDGSTDSDQKKADKKNKK